MGSTPAGRIACRAGAPPARFDSATEAVALQVIHWNFRLRENSLSQCLHPAEQILLARNADDLIAQLAVLEKKQCWNRANVVLG